MLRCKEVFIIKLFIVLQTWTLNFKVRNYGVNLNYIFIMTNYIFNYDKLFTSLSLKIPRFSLIFCTNQPKYPSEI